MSGVTVARDEAGAGVDPRADGWTVPAQVESGGDVVAVSRAWPGRPGERARVVVEGRDHHDRVRAGTIDHDGVVALLPSGRDPRLPALGTLVAQTQAAGGEVLVHRAGRRAVVRRGDGSTGGFVKVVRPGRAGAVAAAARTGRELAVAVGLDAPRVLAEDDSTVTTSVLPGRPAHELSEDPGWAGLWRSWARAWTRLQRLPAGERGWARHTSSDEAAVVRGWVERTTDAGLLPAMWAARADLAAGLLERQDDDATRPVPTHRDLHDKQLLWDGARLGVLDLDTLCVADPALDPVNLAVHADLRRAQGVWSPAAAAVVREAAAEVLDAAGVDADRRRSAELATVARLVCVYASRPPWREVVLDWAAVRWGEASSAHGALV